MGFYKNKHTGEVYELFYRDVLGAKKRILGVPHLRHISGGVNKSSEPFPVKEDWNRFNTFEEVKHEEIKKAPN